MGGAAVGVEVVVAREVMILAILSKSIMKSAELQKCVVLLVRGRTYNG